MVTAILLVCFLGLFSLRFLSSGASESELSSRIILILKSRMMVPPFFFLKIVKILSFSFRFDTVWIGAFNASKHAHRNKGETSLVKARMPLPSSAAPGFSVFLSPENGCFPKLTFNFLTRQKSFFRIFSC
jgi:hypothetical protein